MNGIKIFKFFFIFILSIFIKNIFSMEIPTPKLERRYSTPSFREQRGCPGMLQELLIISGYFKLEEYVINYLETTKEIENLFEQLDKFVIDYLNITNQTITNITAYDPERITSESEQSVKNLVRFFKICIENKDNEEIKEILKTIETQQECNIATISQDIICRNWTEVTLPNLQEDSNTLSQKLKVDVCEIWNNFISKRLLTKIFQKVEDQIGRNKTIKMINSLQQNFNLQI